MMLLTRIPILFTGLLCLLSVALPAQMPTFQKNYGGPGYDAISDVLELPDGYLLAGETSDSANDRSDALLIRLDKNGAILWQKTYGQFDADGFSRLAIANDGGFIAWGSSRNFNYGNSDAWLVKLDDNGNMLWQKTIGQTQFSEYPIGRIIPMPDGYILSGVKSDVGYLQSFITRVNNNGDTLWTRFTRSSWYNALGAYFLADSVLYLGGNVDALGCYRTMDPATGKILQSHEYQSDTTNWMHEIHPTPDGNLILNGDIIRDISGPNRFVGWVQKINRAGDVLWSKGYKIGSLTEVFANQVLADGSCVLGIAYYPSPTDQNANIALVKIDPNGAVLWARRFGSKYYHDLTRIIQTADGGFFLTGTIEINPFQGDNNAFWIKTDSLGIVEGCCAANLKVAVEDVPLTRMQIPHSETAFENMVPYDWPTPDTVAIAVQDYCANIQPVFSQTIQFCPGESVTLGDSTYTQPTTVTITLPSKTGGCDTLATYTLVNKIANQNSTLQLTCPPDMFVLIPQGANAVAVQYGMAMATSDCLCPDLQVQQVAGEASGSLFPTGLHSICYRAEDPCGSTQTCCFSIRADTLAAPGCETTFFKRLFVPGKSTGGWQIVPAPDGTFFIGGSVGDITMIARCDGEMNVLWAKSLDLGAGSDFITDLSLDADGNIIGVGNTVGVPVNCFAFKMNPVTGQLIWRSLLTSPVNSYFTRILEKNKAGGDNYFLLGQTDAQSGTGCNTLLVEIDRNTGSMLWDKHYTLGSCEIFNDGFIDGNRLYTCGRYNLFGSGQSGYRAAMTAMDLSGNVQWSQHYLYSNASSARMYADRLLPDNGGIVVLGHGAYQGTTTLDFKLGLMKTDTAGNPLWWKKYDITDGTDQIAIKLLNLPDGYLIGGMFARNSGEEIFLIKTDKDGNYLWGKSYGIDGEDYFRDMVLSAGKIYLIGNSQTTQGADMIIGKLNLDGTVDGPCDYVHALNVSPEDFPNPPHFSHTLLPINVTHNYKTLAILPALPENVSTEVICQKLCVDPCAGKPDASVSIDSVFCTEGRTELRLRVCNAGPAALPANTPVALYDADPTTATAKLLLSIPTAVPVDSGACQTLVVPDIGQLIPAGTQLTLAAVVDDKGSLSTPFSLDSLVHTGAEDCDLSNNLGTRPFAMPPAPAVDLGPDRSVCGAGALTLQATPGFFHYAWQDGSTGANFTVLNTGVYRVEVKNTCGIARADSVLVSVLPINQRSELREFCPGETVTIGGINYAQPGTVIDTLPGGAGACDTIVTYTLQYKTANQPNTLKLVCPKDIFRAIPPGNGTAVVAYDPPQASSECPCPGLSVQLQSGGASGSVFIGGINTVCYRAEDACGNQSSCCFTVQLVEEGVCDVKTNGCLKYEILSVRRDTNQRLSYRIRITNNCPDHLRYAYLQVPDGVNAVYPAGNSSYLTPGGSAYAVRNPNYSPFYSVRFQAQGAGIANGESDVFRYVLPPYADPDYIHVAVRLASGAYVETHLNTFNCPVGVEPGSSKPAPGAERGNSAVAPGSLRVYPNPVYGAAVLQLEGGDYSDGVFILQDLTGKTVLESQINGNQVTLQPGGLTRGVYYFKVLENGALAGSGKLVVLE